MSCIKNIEDLSLGELIDKLIMANIKTWHKATLIKSENNPQLSLEDKAKIYLECRVFNTERSLAKSEIDAKTDGGFNDQKLNY